MKYNELKEETRMRILNHLEGILLRMGIKTRVQMFMKKIYDGRELICVESEKFQTQPVIFSSVMVHGRGFLLKEKEDDGLYRLTFNLDFRYELFGGGENGTNIGDLKYYVRNWESGEQSVIYGAFDLVVNDGATLDF